MNDDDAAPEPEDHGFFFPEGFPEELKAQLLDHIARQKMAMQMKQLNVTRFFRELDQDALDVFGQLMNHAVANPPAAAYYEGFARGILAERFGSWPGWSDEEHVASFSFNDEAGNEVAVEVDMGVARDQPADAGNVDALYAQQLEEYGLAQSISGGLFCKNCNTPYVSLADRMLRPPGKEGCSTCIQKEKWG